MINLQGLQRLQKQFTKKVVDHAPEILTAAGVVGVISTTVLAVRAGFEAHARLESIRERYADSFAVGEDLTKMDMLKLTWTCYIPVVTVGAMTIASIVVSSRVAQKRTAALATAYSLANTALSDQLNITESFKKKISETYGSEVVEKIENEVASEMTKSEEESKQILIVGNGEVMVYDSLTGRYFRSDIESIRKAVNDINETIFSSMYASLNDFFVELGLPRTGYGDEVGWNIDRKLAVTFDTKLAENGTPCIALNYATAPIRDYSKVF